MSSWLWQRRLLLSLPQVTRQLINLCVWQKLRRTVRLNMPMSRPFHFEWTRMWVQTKPNSSQPNVPMQGKLLFERSRVSLWKSFRHETRWHMSMSSEHDAELKQLSLQGEFHWIFRFMHLSWRVYFWAVKVFLSVESIHVVKRVPWVWCLVYRMHRKWVWMFCIQLGVLLFNNWRRSFVDMYCFLGC